MWHFFVMLRNIAQSWRLRMVGMKNLPPKSFVSKIAVRQPILLSRFIMLKEMRTGEMRMPTVSSCLLTTTYEEHHKAQSFLRMKASCFSSLSGNHRSSLSQKAI